MNSNQVQLAFESLLKKYETALIKLKHLQESRQENREVIVPMSSKSERMYIDRIRLLENQLKTQLMANILDEYILSVLDQPHYPIFPSSMPRKSIVAIFFFLGLLGSILFFLAKNYLKLIKNLE